MNGFTDPAVTDDQPRDYDRTYPKPLPGPLQIRVGIDTERGDVTRFLIQLEYRRSGEWDTVVRLDHDSEGSDEATHDVTEEGLHVDVYRDGEKVRVEEASGPLPANEALNAAEEHLRENLQRYINRYEQWHGISSGP
jgi:hypothetical protein